MTLSLLPRLQQTTLAACLTLQVDSFALRTRVVQSPVKQGFTLAELLIALALLGIIAAFTIPKVLQSSAEQETNAKLRETVATLEQAWYNVRATNQVVPTNVFHNIRYHINSVSAENTAPTLPGGPYAGAAFATHPCLEGPFPNGGGWFVLANGVVVAGISGNTINGGIDVASRPPVDPTHDWRYNVVFCIDVNGTGGPNLPGQDVFFGNFNQHGGFQAPPVNEQAALKSFRWGNRSGGLQNNVLWDDGNTYNLPTHGAVGDGTRNPCALVGCRLTQ